MAQTILIVDDEQDVAEVLKRRLEAHGFQIALAENGVEGLKYVRSNPVDLIILDIMMPQMSGPEMSALLKDEPRTAKIPIIFLSAILERQESMDEGSGPNIIFAKPYDSDELIAKIKQILRSA